MANFPAQAAAGRPRPLRGETNPPFGGRGAGRFPPRRSYAALDLGTNNCRMLIARPDGDGFLIIDAFSRIVRLGEGLAATGTLSQAAMDRALSALSICANKLARRNVHLSRAVATEACRRASNGADFIDRIRQETGLVMDVITAEEEARLAVMGCHRLIEPGEGPALVFDIGGGSTELILIETPDGQPRILDWLSVPWGVVSLSESVQHDDASPTARTDAYQRMMDVVGDSFSAFAARLPGDGVERRLLGTSGTVTTLASVHLGLPSYDRKMVDGLHVPSASFRDISSGIAAMSLAERAKLPCIGPERADLVVAGCAILDAILDIWPAHRVGVADRGIREGILRQLVHMDGRR